MRVLQIIQKPQLRGAEVFASQLSTHLLKLDVDVHLISLFNGSAKLPFEGKIIHLNRPVNKRLRDFKAWKLLSEIIKEEKPDLIQANAGDTLKFVILSKLFYRWNVPVVFRNANKMGDFIDTKPKYLLNRFFVDKVDAVVSVSRLCEQDFISTFNYPTSRITTIPIGVENHIIPSSPPTDLTEIYSRFRVLVNIGSLVPEKNHEALIRIFELLAKDDPTVYLIIIGDGHLLTKLESDIISLDCSDRVLFTGTRNDVLQVINHATAFLLPSLIEGLPGVILEAMYCKTPVIANNVGGISEVISDATGWLIEREQEKAFVDAVKEVLAGGERVNVKVKQAYQLVRTEYMNKQIAAKFKDVYKRVVAKEAIM